MKTVMVEVRRVFNLGNYENLRLGETIEVEEGDEPTAIRAALVETFNTEFAAIREAQAAQYRAENPVPERWEFKPEMVQEVPDLMEKAVAAHQIVEDHKVDDRVERARKQALEMFGLELEFEQLPNGKPVATLKTASWGEIKLVLGDWGGEFDIVLPPVTPGEKGQVLGSIRSLTMLGERLLAIQSARVLNVPEGEAANPDLPF